MVRNIRLVMADKTVSSLELKGGSEGGRKGRREGGREGGREMREGGR